MYTCHSHSSNTCIHALTSEAGIHEGILLFHVASNHLELAKVFTGAFTLSSKVMPVSNLVRKDPHFVAGLYKDKKINHTTLIYVHVYYRV